MPISKSSSNLFKSTFKSFLATETMGSFLLLFFAGLALFLANSEWHNFYEKLIHYPISLGFGDYSIKTNFHHIINEGLMSLFFFVVGMEVKKEFIDGELSSTKKAALPLLAAIGGSVVPALIFYFFNQDLPTEKGWGIPMATDIAFAVGVMSLLPRKVPFVLKIFLLSIAIIDDIIAVLVIALFYSHTISGPFLAMTCVVSFCIVLYFKLHLKKSSILAILAIALWFFMYKSGIHATLSGVVLGCLIPHRNRWTKKQALDSLTKAFSKKEETSLGELNNLKTMVYDTKSVLQRMISLYYPYVNYIIMPLFAFANAGISIGNVDWNHWIGNPVSYGILIGLCVGKPLGIILFSYLSCVAKFSERPQNVSWSQILAVGFLAGIGFTMSLFIMNLCFDITSSAYFYSKLSILIASTLSALIGLLLLSLGKTVPVNQRKAPA